MTRRRAACIAVAILIVCTAEHGSPDAPVPVFALQPPTGAVTESASPTSDDEAEATSPLPDTHLFTIASADYPSTFDWLGGVAAARDGSVYAMDLRRHRVVRFNADGHAQTAWGSLGSRQGQFSFDTGSFEYTYPLGIAVAPDGAVLVADPGNDRVQRFSAEGRFLSSWGSRGTAPGMFDAPIDLAVTGSGLVVVQDAGNRRIQLFDATGVFVRSWPLIQSCGGGPNVPLGLDSGPGGSIYVGVYVPESRRITTGCVQHYDEMGELLDEWPVHGSSGYMYPRDVAATSDGGYFVSVGDQRLHLYGPNGTFREDHDHVARGLAIDSAGALLIAGNARIDRFFAGGILHSTIESTQPPLIGTFEDPSAVTVDQEGFVYVADKATDRVQRFDRYGVFAGQWGSSGSEVGQFSGLMGLAVAPDGTVFVADTGNDRVQWFRPIGSGSGLWPGTNQGTWGESGSGQGRFHQPTGIAVSDSSEVYVVDAGNRRVQRFSTIGGYLGEFGGPGTGDEALVDPIDVAVDEYDVAYVTDAGRHRVARYWRDEYQGAMGFYGGGDGQFQSPAGIGTVPTQWTSADEPRILVADRTSNLLQRFGGNREALMAWGGEGADLGLLSEPVDVAIAPSGQVYVVEAGNVRVQVYDQTGTSIDLWGSRSLSEYDQRHEQQRGEGAIMAEDVSVGPDGTIYVADREQRIHRFSSSGAYLGRWGYSGSPGRDSQFRNVTAVTADDGGTVHVLDGSSSVIQSFSPAGGFVRSWFLGPDRAPSSKLDPTDIEAAPDGSLLVTSSRESRLLRFDPRGDLIGDWDHWSGNGPNSIAVGPAYDVYTAGWSRFSIDVFNVWGDRVGEWGVKGYGPGEFGGDCNPSIGSCRAGPVATDDGGLVYVGDGGLGRIQRFTRDGQFVDALHQEDISTVGNISWRRFDIDSRRPEPRMAILSGYGDGVHVLGSDPPDGWRAEYFGNEWLAERPLKVENLPELRLEWDPAAPLLRMPSPALSARFQRYLSVPQGVYRFSFSARGGARLWIDDTLVLDSWESRSAEATVDVPLGAAQHDLLVEYRTFEPAGSVSLSRSRVADLESAFLPLAVAP